MQTQRREFLLAAAALGVSGVAGGTVLAAADATSTKPAAPGQGEEEDVSPAEDLMREHGVLKRILMIYEEALRRIDAVEDLSPKPLATAAGIIRTFIEDYHEKLEEDYLFPRFRKAKRLVELVDVLQAQHQAGRRLTDITLRTATPAGLRSVEQRGALAESLRLFVRMYSPHEAREDTILFPALHGIISGHEYDALGEDFEKREHTLFGSDGFEKMVEVVAGIEKNLGLYDLASFTPRV